MTSQPLQINLVDQQRRHTLANHPHIDISATTTSTPTSPSATSSIMHSIASTTSTDLAEFCEFVIASLFEVAPSSPSSTHRPAYGREGIDTPPYTPPLDGQPRKEPPVLVEFIAYALYRTRLPISIVHQSLLLLSRLKQRYPSARGTASSPHRLFLSSLMLSAKISMDDTYSNKSWTIVGSNFFALKEVNQMERELFAFLGWNVVVAKEELDEFVANAQNSYLQARQQQQKQAIQALQSESTKRRRHHEQEDSAREARHQQARNAARALLRPHTYRHQSPSPIRSQCSSASASPSMGSSASSSPYLSRAHSPMSHASIASHPYHVSGNHKHSSSAHYHSYTSCSSSATSSTLPSATHSPTSPASAPLSAGPQTPESEHMDVHPHINDSPDFPEAATYVSKAAKSAHSPLRASRQTTVSA